MKTAMQELIEKMEDAKSQKLNLIDWLLIIKVYGLERKEKDIMLNFYMWMRMNERAEKYIDYSDEDMLNEYLKQTI